MININNNINTADTTHAASTGIELQKEEQKENQLASSTSGIISDFLQSVSATSPSFPLPPAFLPSEISTCYAFYKESQISPSSPEFDSLFSSFLSSYFSFTPEVTTKLVAPLISFFVSYEAALSRVASFPYFLYPEDISYLTSPPLLLLSHSSPPLYRLILTYSFFARLHSHPSGWIKCDAKDKLYIEYLASTSSLSSQEKASLLLTLHSSFGLEMRVVGSKNPVPCFSFTWQHQQQQPSSSPLVLGPLSPHTLLCLQEDPTLLTKGGLKTHDI